MLFHTKKKWIIDPCKNMDKSQNNYAEPKKPDSKEYTLYDSIYVNI